MSKIDFSNIVNLYEQPLPVIQKCVQGKWKWVCISRLGFIGLISPVNTFVEITEDNVVITQIGDEPWADMDYYMDSFSYVWKKKKTISGYSTYMMRNSKNNGWYFGEIKNDRLSVFCEERFDSQHSELYTFVKIK